MAPRRPKAPTIRPSVDFPAHVMDFFQSLTKERSMAGPDDDYETILVESFAEEASDTAQDEPFVFLRSFEFENVVRDISLLIHAFEEAQFFPVDATSFDNPFNDEGTYAGAWIFQDPRACLVGKLVWRVPEYVDDECDASATVTIAWAPTESFAKAHFPQVLSTWYRESLHYHIEPLKSLAPQSSYSDGFLLGQLLRDTLGDSIKDRGARAAFIQTIIRGMQSSDS